DGGPFSGLPMHLLEQLKLGELLARGVGNQVGLHVYDAVPLFDFNLPNFLGESLGSFSGPRGRLGPGGWDLYITFLVASLNAPTYVSVPVQDARVVDEFLARLDEFLAQLARQRERMGFLSVQQDFYHFAPAGGQNLRAYAVQFGPLRWRLFWGRI